MDINWINVWELKIENYRTSLALLNPSSHCCQFSSICGDRTWNSGRVSYLGNVRLAMLTYFSSIYRKLMCHSWIWWIIERFLALLNPCANCRHSSSIWGRSDTESGRVSYFGNVTLAKFTYFSWTYRGLMSDSWKRRVIERFLALLNPSSHCCQSSSICGGSDMEKGRVSYLGNVKLAKFTYFSCIYIGD